MSTDAAAADEESRPSICEEAHSDRLVRETGSLLAEAELLLRIGTWAWDSRSRRFQWSDFARQLLGYPEGTDAELRHLLDVIPETSHDLGSLKPEQRLRQLVAHAQVAPQPFSIRLGDGSTRYLSLHARMLQEADQDIGFAGLVIDRTEQHLVEAQMTRQQHVQTISALAGGIAHEVNNPIQAIMNYAHLIQANTSDPSSNSFAGEIIAETERVSEVINSLLEFARMETGAPAVLDPAAVIQGAYALTSNLMKKSQVQFSMTCEPDLPKVIGRKGQLQQVIVNLLTNSYDAIANQPGTETPREIQLKVSRGELNRMPAVDICVHDCGGGISAATSRRMFEPFFTTKPRALNAGLGLAICQSVVQQHGGEMRCDTDGYSYTQMHVVLPVVAVNHTQPPSSD
jgi:signal transduction histidine kinase